MNIFSMILCTAALCFGQAALTNESIIRSVKEGLGEDLVITAIQTQPGNYSTGLADMTALKAAGVSEKIIRAMAAKGSSGGSATAPPSDNAPAGSSDRLPEPEFHGTVYWLDSSNHALISLERQKENMGTRMIPVPGATVTSKIEIQGKRSPLRFPTDSKPQFVFSSVLNSDPQGLAQIFRLTVNVKKDRRELTLAKFNPFLGGVKGHEQDKESVPFQASRYSDSSITITPTMPLPPGEYGIRIASNYMFCFGVN